MFKKCNLRVQNNVKNGGDGGILMVLGTCEHSYSKQWKIAKTGVISRYKVSLGMSRHYLKKKKTG